MAQTGSRTSADLDGTHVWVVLGEVGSALGPYVAGVYQTREGAEAHVATAGQTHPAESYEITEQVIRGGVA